MTEKQQINALFADLNRLIERYTEEFEISYAAAIGCLHLMADRLSERARHQAEEDS